MKKGFQTIKQFRSVLWILLLPSYALQPASAAPFVESYTLVSSVRSGRSSFDYTYRPLIRVDSNSYRNAAFTVTSTTPATQVVKAAVIVGDLDAGNIVLTPDTFTIRQDRLVPFDRTALQFVFSGTIVSQEQGPGNLSVGEVTFLEPGGRTGHEILLSMPSSDPPAGQSIAMSVDVYGSVGSATYRLLDTSGQELANGYLSQPTDANSTSASYVAVVLVPSQPFKIEISAVGNNPTPFVWLSRLYVPTVTSLRIEPVKGVLSKGETVPVTLRLASTSASSANYTVRLWLPAGLSGNTGPWNVALGPGETRDISTSITAPVGGAAFVRYTVIAEALAEVTGSVPVSCNFEFEVE